MFTGDGRCKGQTRIMRLPNMAMRNGWRPIHLIGALVMVAAAVTVTWSAWANMFYIAQRDPAFSYIFAIPLIFLWLAWVRRERIRLCYPVGQWVGPAIMLLGWGLAWYGFNNAVQSFWQGGSVLIVIGAAVSVLGAPVLWHFLPAVITLGFMVPVPGAIHQAVTMPLQTATASVTHHIYELMGYHVPRSGNVLVINGTRVGIAEACNGLRMVFALAGLSYVFAFSNPFKWYVRVGIIGLSPIIAVLCNVLRILPTVWFYGYSPEQWAKGFHDLAGLAMVFIAFSILLGLTRLLRWALVPLTPYALAYD